MRLAMACVGCSLNSFSVFLLSLKQQQNLMKIMFSCIHFPVWPYPPQNNERKTTTTTTKTTVFYTGKGNGLTGMLRTRRSLCTLQLSLPTYDMATAAYASNMAA